MNQNENYMNQMPLPGKEPKQGPGPIISVIIIIALVALGGYYFWKQVEEKKTNSAREIGSEFYSTSTEGMSAELQADLEALQRDDIGEDDAESIDGEFN